MGQRKARVTALLKRNKKQFKRQQIAIEELVAEQRQALTEQMENVQAEAAINQDQHARSLAQSQSEKYTALVADVQQLLVELRATAETSYHGLRQHYVSWEEEAFWQSWEAPGAFPLAVPLGQLKRDVTEIIDDGGWGNEQDILAAERADGPFVLAADLVLPEAGLLLVQGRDGVPVLHQAMLRLLAGSPLGKVRFSLIDALGLGNNFAPFLSLQDQHEHLVGAKVRTSQIEIERVLADLSACRKGHSEILT